MKDVEAQLIHDMQNTAMVLREAATQLNENRDTLPPGVVAHLCEMLARRSDMLVRLLGDLSTSHLAERGELDLSLQKVSLSDICGELLSERPPTTNGRLTVDVADDALVVGDPLRVTQVLDNLVTNALRYGGPNVHVSTARDGASVQLIVHDDGPGVPDDLVHTLFHAYVRGAESHGLGGSGLGMLIVRQLCEAMGGTIEYDGSRGARFTASFPALLNPSRDLGPDVAHSGHSVALWSREEDLVDSVVAYVAHGLAAGEAVLVAAAPGHHKLVDAALVGVGVDLVAATESGQYVRLDADDLHNDLPRLQHIDRERFETLIGGTVDQVSRRWRSFRVFGEIVDLYWRRGDDHLALELEACWNSLRERVPFPLLCGYELAPGESATAIYDFHDAVVPA
jgi:two-component sensor histidine kinase